LFTFDQVIKGKVIVARNEEKNKHIYERGKFTNIIIKGNVM
jgi:hypothetical protein